MLETYTTSASLPLHLDGLLGQEDELEDVGKGKLEPEPEDAGDSPADYESPEQAPDVDELRLMEEKFARTINIDKALNS